MCSPPILHAVNHPLTNKSSQFVQRQIADEDSRFHALVARVDDLEQNQFFCVAAELNSHLVNDEQIRLCIALDKISF